MKSGLYALPLASALALASPVVIMPAPASAQEAANDANRQCRKAFEALAKSKPSVPRLRGKPHVHGLRKLRRERR